MVDEIMRILPSSLEKKCVLIRISEADTEKRKNIIERRMNKRIKPASRMSNLASHLKEIFSKGVNRQ